MSVGSKQLCAAAIDAILSALAQEPAKVALQGLCCCGRLLQARWHPALLCTACPPGQQVLPLLQVVLVTLGAAAAEEPDAVGVAGQVAAQGRGQAVCSPTSSTEAAAHMLPRRSDT